MILNYFFHAAIPKVRVLIFKDIIFLFRDTVLFTQSKDFKVGCIKTHGISLQSVINLSIAPSIILLLLRHAPDFMSSATFISSNIIIFFPGSILTYCRVKIQNALVTPH